jgi:urea transport system ATP-binding protein
MSMLELCAVRAGYGRLPVLFDVDFTVEPGEWVTVLGANGSGRSTLLKAVLGVVDCTAGEILFRGERVTHDAGGPPQPPPPASSRPVSPCPPRDATSSRR